MDLHLLETFALAEDRSKALDQLIPGSEEHYFYACLLSEQRGDLAQVRTLLDAWNARHGQTALFNEIQHRLVLLQAGEKLPDALEHLRYHLGLQFDHQRTVEGARTSHPSKLDAAEIGRDAVKRHGLAHSNSSDLSGFTDHALEWLADEEPNLEPSRLRHLLQRLQRPDVPRLAELVARELKDRHSHGFGGIPIHSSMLEDQLQQLRALVPELAQNQKFVHTCLSRLQPSPDVDWQNHAPERQAYLDRLWAFVKDLSAQFNALKAHVLFHRLEHDRRLGIYDRDRFVTYARLPRQVPYARPGFLEKARKTDEPFSLSQDFSAVTLLPTVGSDEELVRDYLSHFFLDATDFAPFDTTMAEGFLKEVFATTKILHGVGDMEQWYSMLDNPSFYQALRDRVELELARTNRPWFRADEPVTLEVDVKNVPTLVIKVFELNALNYILANGRDIDTSVDLDGLVATEEQTHSFTEPPLRRVRRRFSFPSLSKPGVYVVELIGGGVSSRALIHKGRLRYVERLGAAGHVFTVLDEDRRPLRDASLWLGGREYRAEDDGTIVVPFSTSPGRQHLLLRHGEFTTLESFEHRAESYQLVAGLYCDRESLLKQKEAQVVLRPSLLLNGVAVSLKLLEEPTLVIHSTDRDGVTSTLEVPGLEPREDREAVHRFQVPENLASIRFCLRGKVQSLSRGQRVELSDERSFQLNGIDTTAHIADLHLARTAAGYVLQLLGKSGEPKPGVAVNLRLSHRDLSPALDFTLQTDARGRVELGHLRDIVWLSASTPWDVTERWSLPADRSQRERVVHLREGEAFRIPFMRAEPLGGVDFPDERGKPRKSPRGLERAEVSLLERRGSAYLRDLFGSLSLDEGHLRIPGLPPGDYELRLKREGVDIAIRVAAGEDVAGAVVGEKRHLERSDAEPLQIRQVEPKKNEIVVRVDPGPHTRVHVFGTRFVPAHSSFDELSRAPLRGLRTFEPQKALAHYISGRDLGDEYRYVLERRFAPVFPGSMLPRPGLLLNPWAVRSTQTSVQFAAAGAAYASAPAPAMRAPGAPPKPPPPAQAGQGSAFANLDFLAKPAAVRLNLVPDSAGIVRIPRDGSFSDVQSLRIVAIAPGRTVCRDVLLPEVDAKAEDLRLRLALEAEAHFSEKKQITLLPEGGELQIADITTSKLELYDSLARMWRLYSALSSHPHLTTFGFLLRWPRLSEEEKRARYSEHACHELSFFLSRKDPEFFERVIKPYLRHKREKTFLDHYLLGDDLSGYLRPWAFGRLNIVERILLGRRVVQEHGPVARHCREQNELLPRDVERDNRLFMAAIQSSALEAGDALGIAAQTERAKEALLDLEMPAMEPAEFAVGGGGLVEDKPVRAKAKKKAMREMARDEEGEAEEAHDRFDRKAERELSARSRVRQLYQQLDKTQEWAESHYYKLPLEEQGPELVTINPFWNDFAAHAGPGPFLSRHIAYAAQSFPEMMFALSVLDLPFESDKPTTSFEAARLTLGTRGSALVFHKEIKPSEPSAERVPVLVSQNYFRDDDRYRYVNGEQVDNYVTGELLVNVVYVCQVVLTNPTSSRQKLDLLLQIPRGAIPVRSGFYTQGKHVELSPYSTESLEYAFYFPAPGSYSHFPVHVTRNEELIASAPAGTLQVVREPSTVDTESWAWVSQNGEAAEVLRWMEAHNLERIARPDERGILGLEFVAWRMRDRSFYDACLTLLERRHVYNATLWAYAVHHGDLARVRDFLEHQDAFLNECGLWLDSPLVRIDPVVRGRLQHLEYAPLVNARTHQLGARRKIPNDRLAQQWEHFLTALRYRRKLTADDRLAVAYYLFVQDRIGEGLEMLDTVDTQAIETSLQYDYMKLNAELLREHPDKARELALRHKDHPVDRWRKLFQTALSQLDELGGAAPQLVDEKDRDQQQARLVSTEPDFDFGIEAKRVTLRYQNLASVRVNYYRMDVELLFSRQPFVQQQSEQFSFVKPNRSDVVSLPEGGTHSFDLPSDLAGANVIVEVVAAGRRKAQAFYAHELRVALVETYGQLRVSQDRTGNPLPKTYVKVYARTKTGEVRFFKDGYTDLRGAFDYTSLSTDELDQVQRFALLIMSEKHGAVIREAAPPAR